MNNKKKHLSAGYIYYIKRPALVGAGLFAVCIITITFHMYKNSGKGSEISEKSIDIKFKRFHTKVKSDFLN